VDRMCCTLIETSGSSRSRFTAVLTSTPASCHRPEVVENNQCLSKDMLLESEVQRAKTHHTHSRSEQCSASAPRQARDDRIGEKLCRAISLLLPLVFVVLPPADATDAPTATANRGELRYILAPIVKSQLISCKLYICAFASG
jgi:hypothetical protein